MWIKIGKNINFHETLRFHRKIVIEIPVRLIYGNTIPKIYSPKYRRISGENPEGVEKSIKLLK